MTGQYLVVQMVDWLVVNLADKLGMRSVVCLVDKSVELMAEPLEMNSVEETVVLMDNQSVENWVVQSVQRLVAPLEQQ